MEENDEISKAKIAFEYYMKEIYNKYHCISNEVLFAGMITKKTFDILDTLEYVYNKQIISVQISLIRLLCDNCLAIEAAKELGLPMYMKVLNEGMKVNQVAIDEENNMSDGYLRAKIAEKYPIFNKIYKYACDGVHFSNQALTTLFKEDDKGKMVLSIEVGNKDMKEEVKLNRGHVITICKIILYMLKDLCL